VAGGHTTDPPATLTYSSVVSHDSFNCREKIDTIGGPEFGSNEVKPLIITKALYGL
jgi:hypothetical protein